MLSKSFLHSLYGNIDSTNVEVANILLSLSNLIRLKNSNEQKTENYETIIKNTKRKAPIEGEEKNICEVIDLSHSVDPVNTAMKWVSFENFHGTPCPGGQPARGVRRLLLRRYMEHLANMQPHFVVYRDVENYFAAYGAQDLCDLGRKSAHNSFLNCANVLYYTTLDMSLKNWITDIIEVSTLIPFCKPDFGTSLGGKLTKEMAVRKLFVHLRFKVKIQSRGREVRDPENYRAPSVHFQAMAVASRVGMSTPHAKKQKIFEDNSQGGSHKGDGPPRHKGNYNMHKGAGKRGKVNLPEPQEQKREPTEVELLHEDIALRKAQMESEKLEVEETFQQLGFEPWVYVYNNERSIVEKYGRVIYHSESHSFIHPVFPEGQDRTYVSLMHDRQLMTCEVLPAGNHATSVVENFRFKRGVVAQHVVPPIVRRCLPDVVGKGMNIQARMYTLLLPVLKLIPRVATLNPRNAITNEHVYQVMQGKFENMSSELALETWNYHRHDVYAKYNGIGDGAPGRYYSQLRMPGTNITPLFDTAGIRGPHKMKSRDCELPIDWPVKTLARIKLDGRQSTGEELKNLLPIASRVNEFADTRYNRTIAYRLRGERDFVLYEANSHNMIHAMKRVIGAREGEEIFYNNQFSLWEELRPSLEDPMRISTIERVNLLQYAIGILEARCTEAKSFFFAESLNLIDHGIFGHVTVFGDKARVALYECIDSITGSTNHTGKKLKDVTAYSDFLAAGYCEVFSWESASLAVDIEHVKARLRKAQLEGAWGKWDMDAFVRRIELRVKKEWAKNGKAPRAYSDYQAGGVACGELPEMVKIAIHGSTVYQVGSLRVEVFINAKPSNENLEYIFRRSREATAIMNYMFVAVYSDDALYSGNIRGAPFSFNVDISSCDTSNNELIFGITEYLMGCFNKDKARFLVDMCRLTIRTVLKCDDGDHSVEVTFPHPFEGSGTVLTTILNHTASLCIALMAAQQCGTLDIAQAIPAGAALVGHKVTVQSNEIDGRICFEKMQFLKCSTALSTDGDWVIYQNLGCFLRSFGSVEGDLQPRMVGLSSEEFRQLGRRGAWMRFLASVVKGQCNEPHNIILDALRAKFLHTTNLTICENADENIKQVALENLPTNNERFEDFRLSHDRSGKTLDPASVSLRYSGYNMSNIGEIIAASELFTEITDPLISAIMEADYELTIDV